MELYLMRHGEAHESVADPARPLTDGGRLAVERVAMLAAERGARVDCVYHSGILRAQQTAELLAQRVGPGAPVEARPGLAPEDSIGPVAQWLLERAADPAAGAIAVVGHLPFLERLAAELVADPTDSRAPAFRPATLVRLVAESARFRVDWTIHPESAR